MCSVHYLMIVQDYVTKFNISIQDLEAFVKACKENDTYVLPDGRSPRDENQFLHYIKLDQILDYFKTDVHKNPQKQTGMQNESITTNQFRSNEESLERVNHWVEYVIPKAKEATMNMIDKSGMQVSMEEKKTLFENILHLATEVYNS